MKKMEQIRAPEEFVQNNTAQHIGLGNVHMYQKLFSYNYYIPYELLQYSGARTAGTEY